MNLKIEFLFVLVTALSSYSSILAAEVPAEVKAMGGWEYRASYQDRCHRAERWVIGKPNGLMVNKWFFIEPNGDLSVVNASIDCGNTTKIAALDKSYYADPKLLVTLDPAIGIWAYSTVIDECQTRTIISCGPCFITERKATLYINRAGVATLVRSTNVSSSSVAETRQVLNDTTTTRYSYSAGKMSRIVAGVVLHEWAVVVRGNTLRVGTHPVFSRVK